MRGRERDILFVALMAALAMMSVFAQASPALRTLFGLPLVLYLPGYAILRTTFREPGSRLEVTAFAIGLSIVVTIVCGFALHLLDGLSPEGWALSLGTVTLTACGAAYARHRPTSFSKTRPPLRRPPLGIGHAAMMVCAVLIAIGTVALSRQWAIAHRQFAYTEFWMMPHVSGGDAFTIGVRNAERSASSYDLELLFDDQTVAVRRSIQLGVDETWHSDFVLPMGQGATHAAEARLFRSGESHLVYRRVWLKTAPGS